MVAADAEVWFSVVVAGVLLLSFVSTLAGVTVAETVVVAVAGVTVAEVLAAADSEAEADSIRRRC